MAFDPLTQSPIWWLDASDPATIELTSTDRVRRWLDKSGNNNHFVVADTSVAKRPKYLASDPIANNKPSISAVVATSMMTQGDLDGSGNLVSKSAVAAEIYLVMAAMTGVETQFTTANLWQGGGDGYAAILGIQANENRLMGTLNSASWIASSAIATGTRKNGSATISTVALPMALSVHRVVATASPVTTTPRVLFNSTPTAARAWKGPLCAVLAFSTARTDAEAADIVQYLMDRYVNVAAPAINGTLSTTDADDTQTAVAKVLIKGSLSSVDADDVLSATGKVVIKGSLSSVDADDTLTSLGKVVIKGTFSGTDADDILTSVGKVIIKAVANQTDQDDITTASGSVVTPIPNAITGTLSTVDEDDVTIATAKVLISGVLRFKADADDTLSSVVNLRISANLTTQDDDDISASTAAVVPFPVIHATFDVQDADDVLTSYLLVGFVQIEVPVSRTTYAKEENRTILASAEDRTTFARAEDRTIYG